MREAKDWGQPCPNPACTYYTLMHRANIKAIASYQTQSGTRRIFVCKECEEQFSETRDTVFYDLRAPEEKVMLVLKLLLCKVELTSISFALGVTEETALAWLQRAAQQAAEINHHLCGPSTSRRCNGRSCGASLRANTPRRRVLTAKAPMRAPTDGSGCGSALHRSAA